MDSEQWTELDDDTDLISISVPATWTAIDLTPGQNKDGTLQPWISATTDEFLFFPPRRHRRHLQRARCGLSRLPARVGHHGNPRGLRDITTSARPIRCRPSTTASTSGTSRRSTPAAVRRRASSPLPPTPHRGAFTSVLLVQLTGRLNDAATLDGLLTSFDQVVDDTAPTTPAPTATPNEAGALQHYVLQEYGWTIDEAQARCLLDQPDLDPLPGGPILLHLVNCGPEKTTSPAAEPTATPPTWAAPRPAPRPPATWPSRTNRPAPRRPPHTMAATTTPADNVPNRIDIPDFDCTGSAIGSDHSLPAVNRPAR